MKQKAGQVKRYRWIALLVSAGLLLSIGVGSLWLDNQIKTTFRNFIAFAQDVYSPSPPPPPPPPGGEYCGDGYCNAGETSASCPGDCGGEGSCPDGICQAGESCSFDCAVVDTCNICPGDLCCDDGSCADQGSGLGCWDPDAPGTGTECSGGGDCTGTCRCPDDGATDWDCTWECGNGNCYSSCTEADGGGGGPPACINTSPDIPTLSSPTNGSVQFSPSITLDWNPIASWGTDCPPPDPDSYIVYVGFYAEGSSPSTPICSRDPSDPDPDPTSCAIPNDSDHEWLFRPGEVYAWRVVATNGVKPSSSTTWSYTVGGRISGTVYEDTTPGACSETTTASTGWNIKCDLVDAEISGANFTCKSGDYPDGSPITALTRGSHNIALETTGSYQFSCSNPYSMSEAVDLQPPPGTPNVQGYNVMITQARDAWFQAKGGELHADSASGGVTVRSEIPDTCIGTCEHYLMLQDDTTLQSGTVSRASGTQDFGTSGGEVSFEGWQARAGSYEGVRADYDFWKQHLSDVFEDTKLEVSGQPAPGFWETNETLVNPFVVGNWTVAGTEQIVIVHKGNVQVSGNVDVQPGGSLVIIASESISFDPAVFQAEGVYVANNAISTGTTGGNNDVAFRGEGTFIGWNTIYLQRVLSGTNNNTNPAEFFIYRPDIVFNLPAEVKRPLYTWREVP